MKYSLNCVAGVQRIDDMGQNSKLSPQQLSLSDSGKDFFFNEMFCKLTSLIVILGTSKCNSHVI